MNYSEITKNGKTYIECLQDGQVLRNENDALDLIAACGEYGAAGVLLHAANLDQDFYDLKSGLAGAVLLKFSNYRIRLAAVIPPEHIQGRFGEMVLEENRGNQFRVFGSRQEAEDWLLTGMPGQAFFRSQAR